MTISIACDGEFGNRAGAREFTWLHLAALSIFLLASSAHVPLLAQGLNSGGAVESIIGSEVQTEEHAATDAEIAQVIDAISRTSDTAMEARMVFSLAAVKIVFIPEAEDEGSSISQAVAEHDSEIRSLRQAVQGNAMLFHSIDSHSILLDKILAIDFGEDESATIFVAGSDPSQ